MKNKFKQKLEKIVNKMNWKLSDNADEIIQVIINKGYKCPCRLDNTPCPCKYLPKDIEESGSCFCNLFIKE